MNPSRQRLIFLVGGFVLLNTVVGIVLDASGAKEWLKPALETRTDADQGAGSAGGTLLTAIDGLAGAVGAIDVRLSQLEKSLGASVHKTSEVAAPVFSDGALTRESIQDSNPGGFLFSANGPPSLPDQRAGSHRPVMEMVNPTPEQQSIFLSLKSRFSDPSYVWSLKLDELMQSEEIQQLPEPLQRVLISRAIDLFNKGAIDQNGFISEMPIGE